MEGESDPIPTTRKALAGLSRETKYRGYSKNGGIFRKTNGRYGIFSLANTGPHLGELQPDLVWDNVMSSVSVRVPKSSRWHTQDYSRIVHFQRDCLQRCGQGVGKLQKRLQHLKVNKRSKSPPLSPKGRGKEELCESWRREPSSTGHSEEQWTCVEWCGWVEVTSEGEREGSHSLSSLLLLPLISCWDFWIPELNHKPKGKEACYRCGPHRLASKAESKVETMEGRSPGTDRRCPAQMEPKGMESSLRSGHPLWGLLGTSRWHQIDHLHAPIFLLNEIFPLSTGKWIEQFSVPCSVRRISCQLLSLSIWWVIH